MSDIVRILELSKWTKTGRKFGPPTILAARKAADGMRPSGGTKVGILLRPFDGRGRCYVGVVVDIGVVADVVVLITLER